jgi:hypothetical protein
MEEPEVKGEHNLPQDIVTTNVSVLDEEAFA